MFTSFAAAVALPVDACFSVAGHWLLASGVALVVIARFNSTSKLLLAAGVMFPTVCAEVIGRLPRLDGLELGVPASA